MAKKDVAVGIDIGGTNTVFGFVDREGNILGEDTLKTSHYDEIEVFVAALYEKIMVTGQKIGNGIELIGFGIGAPMGNINKGTIEHAAGSSMERNCSSCRYFQKAYRSSCYCYQ